MCGPGSQRGDLLFLFDKKGLFFMKRSPIFSLCFAGLALVLSSACGQTPEVEGESNSSDLGFAPIAEHADALTGAAAYDSTLKAPKCASVMSGCDSGTLLNGRGTVGPETNNPNTISGSCFDGVQGNYHGDESLDKLVVTTNDSTSFAPGKSVHIAATVYAYSTTADFLDLYYAANATSPVWVLIGTYAPSATGVTTIGANYTLPSGGSLQAIRGNFRYTGSASSCSPGGYDDHDDLLFAVGAAGPPDVTPPTVTITSPANNATVNNTITITENAADNVGVSKVEIYLDGALGATSTVAPFSFTWNTTAVANGAHNIQTKAYDAANNSTVSTLVNVTVSNSCTTSTELVINGSFEGGHTGWTENPFGIVNNGTYAARGGSWKSTLRGKGFSGADNLWQDNTFTIPAGACSVTLSFYASIFTNETGLMVNDTMWVELLDSSGSVLTTTHTLSNTNANSGYTKYTASLMAWQGTAAKIRFRAQENVSAATTWLIDDVSVIAVQ